MLKEMIDFSNALEEAGIYTEIIEKKINKIDKPIMVIPVKDDLSDLDRDNIYFILDNEGYEKRENKFVYKDKKKPTKENEKYREVEINNLPITVKTFDEEEKESKEWSKIVRNLNYYNLGRADTKGLKCIFNNSGTLSFSIFLFLFYGKLTRDKIKYTYIKKYIDKKKDDKKYNETYNDKENIESALFFDKKDKEDENKITDVLLKFGSDDFLDLFFKRVDDFKKYFGIDEFFVIIRLPDRLLQYGNGKQDHNKNIYGYFYEEYWKKKSFNSEDKSTSKSKEKFICGTCNRESDFIDLPGNFNTLNSKKAFLQHHGRREKIPIKICRECAFSIQKFDKLFLTKLNIRIFPLFIDTNRENKPKDEQINIIKNDLSKIEFKDTLDEIGRKTYYSNTDFYLVIRGDGILFFDYITGFKYHINGVLYSKVEALFSSFFNNSGSVRGGYSHLYKNYFSAVDTKDSTLNYLIHKYRDQIFDYFYRAKYNSLNIKTVENMFFELIMWSFNLLHSDEITKSIIIEKMDNYKELNKIFGGDFMAKLNSVGEMDNIDDSDSFFYFLGQLVYYLLYQSEAGEKTHSMVIPFLQAGATNVIMYQKLLPLFERYGYKIAMHMEKNKFNSIFSKVEKYYHDKKDELKFTQDNKLIFLAGYLDDNMFFPKPKTKEEDK